MVSRICSQNLEILGALFPRCNRAAGGYLYAEIYYRSEDAEITVARPILDVLYIE